MKNEEMRSSVYKDQESGGWFYGFEYRWVQFGSSRGYGSSGEATRACEEHIERVKRNDWLTSMTKRYGHSGQ